MNEHVSHARAAAAGKRGGWAAIMVVFALVCMAIGGSRRPPSPLGLDAPPDRFSEARAMPLLTRLSDGLGPRVTGSAAAMKAADLVEQAFRELPNVEVASQVATGTHAHPWRPTSLSYAVRNVLARIPGRRPGTVLVSAHYDSAVGSPGASDNGASVAAAVEIARALAVSGPAERTILITVDDAEEMGLAGASAMLKHPWFADVEVFLNLDASGPRGKALLFQASGGSALIGAYARAAVRPSGTSLAQDLFRHDLLPVDTDSRVFRGEGAKPGVDLVLFRDGFSYHSAHDRLSGLEPGALQHLGETALALVRGLAASPGGQPAGEEQNVFYDLLGLVMIVYSSTAQRLLGGLVLLGAFGVAVRATRRTKPSVTLLLEGLILAWGGVLAGTVMPVAAAWAMGNVLQRPHGWYSAPWLITPAFGALALAGVSLVHWGWSRWCQWRRRGADTYGVAAGIGGVVLFGTMLGACLIGDLGSSYLPMWALAACSASLAAEGLGPKAKWAVTALALALAAVVWIAVLDLLLGLLVPLAGRTPASMPLDFVVAAAAALPVALLAQLLLSRLHATEAFPWAFALSAGVGLIAMAALCLRFAYDEAHPKRLQLAYVERNGVSSIAAASEDALALGRAELGLLEKLWPADAVRASKLELALGGRVPVHEVAAPAGEAAQPTVEIGPATQLADGLRTVSVSLQPNGHHHLVLQVPKENLVSWSLGAPLPKVAAEQHMLTAEFIGTQAAPWRVDLTLKGGVSKVRVAAEGTQPISGLQDLQARLPPWATAVSRTLYLRDFEL